MSLREQFAGWNPGLWAKLASERASVNRKPQPLPRHGAGGLGQPRPWRYAYQVLTRGACDGCALGVGLPRWTIDGVHLCTASRPAGAQHRRHHRSPGAVRRGAAALTHQGHSGAGTARVIRCAAMRRPGFRRVSWDEALSVLGARLRLTAPDRPRSTSPIRQLTRDLLRGQPRPPALGIASIDSAAGSAAPSTVGLMQTVGASHHLVPGRDRGAAGGAGEGSSQPQPGRCS